jgi:hypothetical protein
MVLQIAGTVSCYIFNRIFEINLQNNTNAQRKTIANTPVFTNENHRQKMRVLLNRTVIFLFSVVLNALC